MCNLRDVLGARIDKMMNDLVRDVWSIQSHELEEFSIKMVW